MIVIGFHEKTKKIEVLLTKKGMGPILSSQLVNDDERGSNTITYSNRLSMFNLFVQRNLYRAKQHNTINDFRFHNYFFQVKRGKEDDKWILINCEEALMPFRVPDHQH
jgi:hypothetical protein